MANSNQLLIPDIVKEDPNAFELLRVWVAHNEQHMNLREGVWEDPAAWGIMLSDLAKLISSTYQQDRGLDQHKVLQRIKAALDVELSNL